MFALQFAICYVNLAIPSSAARIAVNVRFFQRFGVTPTRAMSAGVMVVTSPAAATTEAIHHEVTGLVAEVTDAAMWVEALRSLATDDRHAERLRAAARNWVEENFDAHKNAARLHALFLETITQ